MPNGLGAPCLAKRSGNGRRAQQQPMGPGSGPSTLPIPQGRRKRRELGGDGVRRREREGGDRIEQTDAQVQFTSTVTVAAGRVDRATGEYQRLRHHTAGT